MATGGEVNFPKTLALPNSRGIEKWDNSLPIFLFLLFFLQFHHLHELMCESEHLLEPKKIKLFELSL
jgi:hypothetical protein